MQDLGPVKTHALSLVTQSGYKYRPVNGAHIIDLQLT